MWLGYYRHEPLVPGYFIPLWNKWCQTPWLTPVILATQEAEISRIKVRSQSREIIQETLSYQEKGLVE
jgi:hypothetical protein